MNQESIKVLHVSWSLKTGGLEQVILNLVKPAARFGVAAEVAVLEEEGALAAEARAAGARVHLLGKRPGLDWRMPGALRRICKSGGVDILHGHNAGAGLYAAVAGRLCGRPSLVTRHGKSFETGEKSAALRKVAGRLARATVCVGRDVLQQARDVDRIPTDRLSIIYNGVDVAGIASAGPEREKARAELGMGPEEFLVITVARLSPVKDLGVLLAALDLAGRRFPSLRLCLVGDGPIRADLEGIAAQLGLGGRALFLGRRRDVPRLLAAADVFALSSLSEGISMAVLEAMAAGLPVAGTLVGGMPELVEEGVNGLLSPPGEPELLANSLASLAGDRERSLAMGRAGRARVGQVFSIEAMNNSYLAVYRRLLGRGQ